MSCGLALALIFELVFRALSKFMIGGPGGNSEVGASFSQAFLALATAICDVCQQIGWLLHGRMGRGFGRWDFTQSSFSSVRTWVMERPLVVLAVLEMLTTDLTVSFLDAVTLFRGKALRPASGKCSQGVQVLCRSFLTTPDLDDVPDAEVVSADDPNHPQLLRPIVLPRPLCNLAEHHTRPCSIPRRRCPTQHPFSE